MQTEISDDTRADVVREFAQTINKHSLENGSDTPDFILAEYLMNCLESYNEAHRARKVWYSDETQSGPDSPDPS